MTKLFVGAPATTLMTGPKLCQLLIGHLEADAALSLTDAFIPTQQSQSFLEYQAKHVVIINE